jgi:hypothetical protein
MMIGEIGSRISLQVTNIIIYEHALTGLCYTTGALKGRSTKFMHTLCPLHEKMGAGKSKNGSLYNVEIEDIREK